MTRIALAAALLATAAVPASAAELLVNGSFETPTVTPGTFTQYGNGGNIGGWTVSGNDVLAIDNGYSEANVDFEAQSGLVALDLTGAGNTGANAVSQTVTLAANQLYRLTFQLGNVGGGPVVNQTVYGLPSSIEVLFNGVSQGTFTNAAGAPGTTNWLSRTIAFNSGAGGATTVTFRNATPAGDNYAGLDSVSLAVPEPATWAMMIMGFGLIGAALRRRSTPALAAA